MKAAGINAAFYVSPLTAHEFQSWRRSLRESSLGKAGSTIECVLE